MFEKAKYFIENKKILQLDRTEHSTRFKVGEFEVVLKYQNSELIWLCTCKSGENKPKNMCSHAIAAMSFITKHINTTTD